MLLNDRFRHNKHETMIDSELNEFSQRFLVYVVLHETLYEHGGLGDGQYLIRVS